MTNEHNSTQENLNEVRQELAEKQRLAAELQESLAAARQEISAKNKFAEESKSSLESTTDELEVLKAKNADNAVILQSLERDIAIFQDQEFNLKACNTRLEARVGELEKENKALSSDAQGASADAQETISKLRKQVAEMEQVDVFALSVNSQLLNLF